MRFFTKGKRITALVLALILLVTNAQLPTLIFAADVLDKDADYASHKDGTAKFNEELINQSAQVYIAAVPGESWSDNNGTFDPADYLDLQLIIVDYYKCTTGLWYKVKAAEGHTLPEKLASYPWIYQNDWGETPYVDALIVTPKSNDPSEPTEPSDSVNTEVGAPTGSIVSDKGITVFSDSTELTALTIENSDYVPNANYVQNFVVYTAKPKMGEGDYSGHATVTIPIPEGWDNGKIFGFVVEADGNMTVIPGEVTEFGAFRFTVPHFSDVGLLEVTAVSDVNNVTITFGRVRDEHIYHAEGKYGTAGRHISDDGKVQYVVNHYTANGTTTTYITFMGLDVTERTMIQLGDLNILVIVKKAENTVNKLLTGGEANTMKLYPMYDLGFSGDFDLEFAVTSGDEYLTLSDEGQITAVANKNGEASVVANVKHKTSKSIVGTVTYNVTVTSANVTDVKNIYVPKGGTVQIADLTGSLNNSLGWDPNIVTVNYETDSWGGANILKLTGVAESGETSVIVDKTLFRVYAEPENPDKNNVTVSVLIKIVEIENCSLYYAINGGALHKIDDVGDGYVLIGLSDSEVQKFPDAINIIFFSAPDAGYTTSKITVPGSLGQFYALANGFRYDGSDSDAWPLQDPDAQTVTAQKGNHGIYGALSYGAMTVAELRDLYTRALALGCDSATNFNRYNTSNLNVSITAEAEKFPEFTKTIKAFKRGNQTYTYDNQLLEMGDVVTYEFTVKIPSRYISYEFMLSDATIGLGEIGFEHTVVADKDGNILSTTPNYPSSMSCKETSEGYIYTMTYDYVIGMTDGSPDESKISNYSGGQFTNTALLSYEYKSNAASSKTSLTQNASFTCEIGGVVTWQDSLGNVWQVAVPQGNALPDDPAEPVRIGYAFDGWEKGKESLLDNGGLDQDDNGNYVVDFGESSSITILGTYSLINYSLSYDLDGGELPTGVSNPTIYTVESVLKLPTPSKPGYTFQGWKVTHADGNWTADKVYAGETTMPPMYGHVTLQAQWEIKKYTVTWVNENGTVLETDKDVPHGTTPEYNGSTPTKQNSDRYTYIFVGWTPEIAPVTGDITYKATFEVKGTPHTITWVDGFGNTLKSEVLQYGATVTKPADPTKEGHTFAGWDTEIPTTMPAKDLTITATWTVNKYTITWIVDGKTTTEEYAYGATPSFKGSTDKASDAQYTYTFTGWDKEITAVTGDVNYTAQYSKTVNKYTITWIVDGKTTTEEYEYGTTPSFKGSTDKAADAEFTYTFTGWDPVIDEVTGAATYTAQYSKTPIVKFTTLTIKVTGCNATLDPNQGFLFTVVGTDGVELTVAVLENGFVTIEGVTIGATYTVTMDDAWSWRYDVAANNGIIGANVTGVNENGNSATFVQGENGELTFNVDRTNDRWLDGNGWGSGTVVKN